MKRIFTTILSLCLLLSSAVFAADGKVVGKVIDKKTNEVLIGVTVIVEGTSKGSVTDVEGRFSLNLAPGKYSLVLQYVGYQKKILSDVIVKSSGVQELNVTLESAAKDMKEVVVTASVKKESINALLSMQKNNASISDGISAEVIRKSPDRNTSEVLKRVSGTSVQDNKFVIVRGLTDRYNAATINNAILPSSEPDRKAFSFDIVPSNLIDNILIYKTANPDLPGDFSGGVVQVMTKDIPNTSFLDVSAAIGTNSISTGKDFNPGYVGGGDFLGFDDGSRSLPDGFPSTSKYRGASGDQQATYAKKLPNRYGDRYDANAWPSQNYQVNWGLKKDFRNEGTFGSILSVTYRNSQNIVHSERRDYESEGISDLAFDYKDTIHRFSTNLGALANFAYKKGRHKIAFKNLFNRLFENNNLLRRGFRDNVYLESTGTETMIKTLLSSQLEGEHRIGKESKFSWNLNYALTMRDQPDYHVLPYNKDSSALDDPKVPLEVVLRDTYRFYSDLQDNAYGGSLNYSLPFKWMGRKHTLKAGVLKQYKTREFSARIFRYNTGIDFADRSLMSLPARSIFSKNNIGRNGFILEEVTNNTDKYDAWSDLNAGYVMLDNRLGEKFRLVWGVRVESFVYEVNTSDFSGEKVRVERDYLDVLPSLNLTYNMTEKTNLRLSGSRTVTRPEFREVANFSYYDFTRNAILKGNPNLERGQNTNADFRFETYPSGGEVLSASLFMKHFDKPIEQVIPAGAPASNLILTYANPNSAMSYGIEVEVRKKLSFINDAAWLENFVAFANAAIIRSKVDLKGIDYSVADPDRPMQGQSPYLINAGLQYSSPNTKWSVSALYNKVGQRIAAVGFGKEYPDIYENGRDILDFQISYKILSNKGEIKLNVGDVLAQKSIFYQNLDDKRTYASGTDKMQYSFRYGTNFSLGLAINLTGK